MLPREKIGRMPEPAVPIAARCQLVNRALERPGMEYSRQVENRPRRSGARDSAPGRELLIPQDPWDGAPGFQLAVCDPPACEGSRRSARDQGRA